MNISELDLNEQSKAIISLFGEIAAATHLIDQLVERVAANHDDLPIDLVEHVDLIKHVTDSAVVRAIKILITSVGLDEEAGEATIGVRIGDDGEFEVGLFIGDGSEAEGEAWGAARSGP